MTILSLALFKQRAVCNICL